MVGKPRPLFTTVASSFSAVPTTAPGGIFEGPTATSGVVSSIVESPFEPVAFGQEFLRSAGVGKRSGGGVELGLHMWALYSLPIIDETDICRQVVQRQRARSRSERSPVYAGLGVSLRHMGRRDGSAHAPSFDKLVADIKVAEGHILRQHRVQLLI